MSAYELAPIYVEEVAPTSRIVMGQDAVEESKSWKMVTLDLDYSEPPPRHIVSDNPGFFDWLRANPGLCVSIILPTRDGGYEVGLIEIEQLREAVRFLDKGKTPRTPHIMATNNPVQSLAVLLGIAPHDVHRPGKSSK